MSKYSASVSSRLRNDKPASDLRRQQRVDQQNRPIAPPPTGYSVTLEVPPRKPRLAWHGRDRREVAEPVPTQIVEIVRPGRAEHVADELPGIQARFVPARAAAELPQNRLIWTNDNLVALQTLLDERDPHTSDWRYRGKVDLVYIDPPFMVQSDFRVENTIDIDLDEDADVQAKKEPSLVELLAYKDTWRQGLDTFLTMMRRRLELLKELLAPTGSIYVHLDWHAVHYVKVLMDEVFGYENFRNEVTWRRANAHNDPSRFGMITDSLLFFSKFEVPYWTDVFAPYGPEYIASHWRKEDQRGRYRLIPLDAPRHGDGGSLIYEWKGRFPARTRTWATTRDKMEAMEKQGLIEYTSTGTPNLKRYLDEADGLPSQNLWDDISPVNPMAIERLGYPTQKPVALLDRIIRASCPPHGLVLDCFMGSGTACDAAERLGRRWIGIDNSKYAIHLARKRLIQLDGQPRPPEKSQYDYVECKACKNIERKEKSKKSPGPFNVRPFRVENMGVYQRAEAWQDFQTQGSRYRDEMVRVFGGEPSNQSPLLHGRKNGHWVHVGPLDAPVSEGQVWSIAREAQRTHTRAVTILCADFDTLSGSQKEEVKKKTGVAVTIRIIPASAIDEVRRRLALHDRNPDEPIESMAIPAFYSPLSIVIEPKISRLHVKLTLERCEVDIESFLASQRPLIKRITDTMSAQAKKKAQAEHDKWAEREALLQKWLKKATSWQKFVDFWAVDSSYGKRKGTDGKPIFENDWQSFRTRKPKGEVESLTFVAELTYPKPGRYTVAARVTDVFGNDGIATATIEVK